MQLPGTSVEGWLVVDTVAGGLCFGGTRFTPTVTRGEVAQLARCMTWKLRAHGLPVGGCKAGLRIDPADPRLPEALDAFADAIAGELTTRAIIGKDMGATNAMIDAIYARVGVPQLHLVPGAPDRLRDLTGYRPHMTGLGVTFATTAVLGDDLGGCDVLIQGFGAVGAGSAVRLTERGARVVGVSDAQGALHHGGGLPVARLLEIVDGGVIDRDRIDFPCTLEERDALLERDGDVLVLGAGSNCVGAEPASRIRSRLVVEGANFGLTSDARPVLHGRGVLVLPDILANSSSAAMVARQLAAGGKLSEGELWGAIERSIRDGTAEAVARGRAEGRTPREAWLASLDEAA